VDKPAQALAAWGFKPSIHPPARGVLFPEIAAENVRVFVSGRQFEGIDQQRVGELFGRKFSRWDLGWSEDCQDAFDSAFERFKRDPGNLK
jgi:hypothetical protein